MTPFSNAPTEVQVAIINAAAVIMAAKIGKLNSHYVLGTETFKYELEMVAETVCKELS